MKENLKKALIVSVVALGAIAFSFGGYAGYLLFSVRRLGDQTLAIDGEAPKEKALVGNTYKAITYNIGYGAHSQDFTDFSKTGYDVQGNPTKGSSAKAKSFEEAQTNTLEAINTTKGYSPDFILFQEVDKSSTRSFHCDQDAKIKKLFPKFDHTYAVNHHTGYLPTPLNDAQGGIRSGLATISNIKIKEGQRKQCSKASLFDLDRCFSINEIEVDNEKSLFLINVHFSNNEDGGITQKNQRAELNTLLEEKKARGDYVLVGGDFNSDLLVGNPDTRFAYSKESLPFGRSNKPDWISYWFDGPSLAEGYTLIANDNKPTIRNSDTEWEPDKSYIGVTDGFIVSNNIEINYSRCKNIQSQDGNKNLDGFAFSDHDPAFIEFKLL